MNKISNSKRLTKDRYLGFFWILDIVLCDLFEIWCLRFGILNLVKPVYKCLKTYAQVLSFLFPCFQPRAFPFRL
jgi:hypothetical protein